MPGDVKEVATLVANVANLTREMSEVKGMLLSSGQQRVTQHTETTSRLAVIENNQNRTEKAFKEYTDKCDSDRSSMWTEINGVKTLQSNQAAAVGMRSSIVSGMVTSIMMGLAWLGIKHQ